jgi:hypothetical protein
LQVTTIKSVTLRPARATERNASWSSCIFFDGRSVFLGEKLRKKMIYTLAGMQRFLVSEHQVEAARYNKPHNVHRDSGATTFTEHSFTYPNFGVYAGQWKDGHWHGKGTLTFTNGDVYEGQWNHGKLHGNGTTFQNGAVYEGQFKDGGWHGTGTFTFSDGAVYEGQWKNGKRHGTGTFTCSDDKYEGQWKIDKPHGTGTLTLSDGYVYEGQWKKGEYHEGRRTLPDGAVYDGQWKGDRAHGKGTLTFSEGNVYDGQWKDGKLQTKKAYDVITRNARLDAEEKEKRRLAFLEAEHKLVAAKLRALKKSCRSDVSE